MAQRSPSPGAMSPPVQLDDDADDDDDLGVEEPTPLEISPPVALQQAGPRSPRTPHGAPSSARRPANGFISASPASPNSARVAPLRPDHVHTTVRVSSPVDVTDELAELRCPVCLDPFEAPVTLVCNHNVCKRHVLDLAAQKKPAGGAKSDALTVECPKCRVTSDFAGPQAIRVNTEMKAIVDVVVRMLKQRAVAASAEPIAPAPLLRKQSSRSSFRHRETIAAASDDSDEQSPQQQKQAKPLRVRFNVADVEEVDCDDDDDDDEEAPQPTSSKPPQSILKQSGKEKKPTSKKAAAAAARAESNSSNRPKTSDQKLSEVERQIVAQREQLKAERDKRNRDKVDEYKRERQGEIDARRRLAEAQHQLLSPEHHHQHYHKHLDDDDAGGRPVHLDGESGYPVAQPYTPSTPNAKKTAPRPTTSSSPKFDARLAEEADETDQEWRRREAAFLEVKRRREDAKEKVRSERESALAAQVAKWMTNTDRVYRPKAEAGDSAEAQMRQFERMSQSLGVNGTESALTHSEMGRRAEDRLPPMPQLPSREPSPPPPDHEVELRMLEVERLVYRDHDEDISRQSMAELAEKRARKMIDTYERDQRKLPKKWVRPPGAAVGVPVPTNSGAGVGVPVPGVYVPKMKRMHSFPM